MTAKSALITAGALAATALLAMGFSPSVNSQVEQALGTASTPVAASAAPARENVFPSVTASSSEGATWQAPGGDPEHLTIQHEGKTLVAMDVNAAHYNDRGDLSSACGSIAWDAESGWPKPGASSTYYALMSGHVWCNHDLYQLDRLRDVIPGDTMTVAYTSGMTATFTAVQPAQAIAKDQLNADPTRYVADHSDAMVRLSTCDSDSTPRPDGHLSKNIWTLWRRTA